MRSLPTAALVTLAVTTIAITPAIALAEGDAARETWQAKGQTTWVWQHKGAFTSPYASRNSLSGDPEKSYTFTTTGYFGYRPWAGGEVYLNPEITQGVAFSNLTGTAGFTNGEITRTSGTSPKIYRQRLFLRQTWNHGGATQVVESTLNQMAGTVAADRFVLTAGNFSSLDVFDGNAYAKDPRSQFMNWGNMTHAAYDYAADARGFGWGFAGEWYMGDWALRFGRMTGPRDPNMLPVDFAIGRHYGDQLELEHAHMLAGQPGKVRVLAWRNRSRLASYADALAYLRSNPAADPQTILQVRNGDRIKYGLGVNVEQAISADAGVFLRAMRADGRTETWAFTEVDTSLAFGSATKGTTWGRAQDTVGVAYSRNALRADRRSYLQAGGLSFFIGDGVLNYRPETTTEAYYSWAAMRGISLTAGYQFMRNPAYNADRGPVKVASFRFHAEF